VRIYEEPWEDKPNSRGVTTDIQKLDFLTGGFQSGEVTIIGAWPSMGKTDVMLHFVKISGWAGFLPLIFSLEMPEKLITSRLMASTGELTVQKCEIRKEYYLRVKNRNGRMTLSLRLFTWQLRFFYFTNRRHKAEERNEPVEEKKLEKEERQAY